METITAILSVCFIVGVVFFGFKLSKNIPDEKRFLMVFMCLILACLVGLFIVDKVFYLKNELLAPEASKQIFELIKSQTLLIFGYYFGVQTSK